MFRIRSRVSPVNRSMRRRASVLVETACCLAFVLLPLTAGVAQYGVILTSMHQLDHFAREGGRYAAVHGGETTFDSGETVSGSLKNYLKGMIDKKTIFAWSDVSSNIVVDPSFSNRRSGEPITVTITYEIRKKYFLQNFPGMDRISPTYVARSTFVLE